MTNCEYCSKVINSEYPTENRIALMYERTLQYHTKCFRLVSGVKQENLYKTSLKCLCCEETVNNYYISIFYYENEHIFERRLCLNCIEKFIGLKTWQKISAKQIGEEV